MAWFPIVLTDDEQRIVNAERESHPEAMSLTAIFVFRRQSLCELVFQ
jgi:hypothetical protein